MPNGFLNFTLNIAGRVELDRTFAGRIERVTNLRPLFKQMADDFREMEQAAFAAQGGYEGEARWQDLSKGYKAWKSRHYPGKPILQRTGDLLSAATRPGETITDTQLRLTINNRYAIYHQSDLPRTSKLPRRPVVALSANRKRRWQRMVREYIWAQ